MVSTHLRQANNMDDADAVPVALPCLVGGAASGSARGEEKDDLGEAMLAAAREALDRRDLFTARRRSQASFTVTILSLAQPPRR